MSTGLDAILLDFIQSNIIAVSASLLAIIAVILVLRIKINYKDKIVDMKEAPIGINNLLRYPIKRDILKKMRKEKKYLSRIAKEVGMDPARARFHLKQLESFKLLSSYKLSRESYYSLTDKGRWCLDALKRYYPETVFGKIMSQRMKLKNRSHEIG